MNQLFAELEKLGFKKEETMERFIYDEEFYISCLKEVLEEPGFEGLGEALRTHKVMEAFECAHMLKGVISNMGLTSLFDIVVELVEPLRHGSDENLMEIYESLMQERKKYQDIVSRY